jgi:hypothetical protein
MNIKALRAAIAGTIGAVTTALGIGCSVGVCICSIPAIVFILSIFGISTLFIYQNSLVLSGIGIIFIAISAFSLFRIISGRKTCNLKERKK